MTGEVNGNRVQVSVIITCFDQGEHLGEAIESALAQDYTNVEIVVIDDGSGDNTPAVSRQYAGVKYVRQTNQGLPAARNAGIRASHGEYLVFLDADDRLLPGALAAGVRYMRAYPDSAFVAGGYCCINESGRIVSLQEPARIDGDHYLALLRSNYIGMHGAVLYQRKVLEKEGGFDASLPACEDYEMYLRLARMYPVRCHQTLVAEYRIHASNMSADVALMLPQVLHVLRSQHEYVQTDQRRMAAYSSGLRYWKLFYARRFFSRFIVGPAEESRGSLLQALSVMLRYAPREFLEIVYLQVVRPNMPGFLLRTAARFRGRPYCPPVGRVRFGDLRRTTPVSAWFGCERGLPVDRYYIERFLGANSGDIRGEVLEVGDDGYTRRFGGNRVARTDVLHVSEGNPRATIVADLSRADGIPSGKFDCIILTQTLHLIYELRPVLQTIYRILKPGGVLLATVPGISQISRDQWAQSWYWSFPRLSMRRLTEEYFPSTCVEVEAYGNVLATIGFLQGIASDELDVGELDYRDPQYEMLVVVRASKPA
jgi:glycosyltransferase involved in cell wall biosynthesis